MGKLYKDAMQVLLSVAENETLRMDSYKMDIMGKYWFIEEVVFNGYKAVNW